MKTRIQSAARMLLALIAMATEAPAGTLYVDLASENPAFPYDSWETAAPHIQPAIDAAGAGDVVVVNDGFYALAAELEVSDAIVVTSLNGPESTVIDGGDKVRCLNLGASLCTINGFTIQRGRVSGYGAGIFCEDSSPVITNCIIRNNTITSYPRTQHNAGGGGIYRGRAVNCVIRDNVVSVYNGYAYGGGTYATLVTACVISNNHASWGGGGLAYGSADGCTITGNQVPGAAGGGGALIAELSNCVISGNKASWRGGGLAYGSASHCIISGNVTQRWGGGLYRAPATNCTIAGNTARYDGGGASESEVRNSLVIDNQAGEWGGGLYLGSATNCTIIRNEAETAGGIIGATRNSIVWYNQADSRPDTFGDYASYTRVEHSCAPDVDHGIDGNITNPPMFVDPEAGDFRLVAASPCIDAGSNALAPDESDFAGNPRIADGDLDGVAIVDMGAYETLAMEVPIEVRPRTMNPGSKGRCSVALHSTENCNVSDIDTASLRFAGAVPVHVAHPGGVLILQFSTAELELSDGDTEAMLTGQTHDGQPLFGLGLIRMVPAGK